MNVYSVVYILKDSLSLKRTPKRTMWGHSLKDLLRELSDTLVENKSFELIGIEIHKEVE